MKIFKRGLMSLLCAMTLVGLASCNKEKPETTTDESSTSEVVPSQSSTPTPTQTSTEIQPVETTVKKSIGVDGGEVVSASLALNIPANALNSNTEISVQYVADEKVVSSEPTANFLGMAEFGPSGTQFNTDVEATIKLAKATTNTEISVFCYDEVNGIWDYVTSAAVTGDNATFNITHFSKYMCLDFSPSLFTKYDELVKEAKNTGKSDAWITTTYHDYLVNEKHILDYYQEYDGLYYKAIGLRIAGNYQVDDAKGDVNELTKQYGKTNNVGNKYGLSTLGDQTISYNDYLYSSDKITEKHSATNVMVEISYEMIKPTIDVNVASTTLCKDQTTKVEVYCHYADSNNAICKDLALPNYTLTLPFELTKFSVDTKEIVTDDLGKASFNITALEKGTETVKIMFYVEGPFGEYASAYTEFTCDDGISISGHVTEKMNMETEADKIQKTIDEEYSGEGNDIIIDIKKAGGTVITLDYDVVGSLIVDGNNVSGQIQFKNIKAKVTSSECELYVKVSKNIEIIEEELVFEASGRSQLFKDYKIENGNNLTFNVVGTINNSKCSLSYVDNTSNVICKVTGKEDIDITINFEGSEIQEKSNDDSAFIVNTSSSKPLLDFSLDNGTTEYNANNIKDNFELITYGEDAYTLTKEDAEEFVEFGYSFTTKQTITIA